MLTPRPRIYLLLTPTPPRYPYFEAVVGLVWSNDPERNARSTAATGRPSMPDRSKAMNIVL
jgi:hypothetical protein